MNIFIDKKFARLFNEKFYKKKENIYCDELNIDNFVSLVSLYNKDYHDKMIEFLNEDLFLFGLDFILQESLTNYSKCFKANQLIDQIMNIPFGTICEYGQELVNQTQGTFKNTKREGFKMFINSNSTENISPLYIFKTNPTINVIIIYNEDCNKIEVICRNGFEVFNKKIFGNIKQYKTRLIINVSNYITANKIFEKLKQKDIKDSKDYEYDSFRDLVKTMKKDEKFVKEFEETFIMKCKQLFGNKLEEKEIFDLYSLFAKEDELIKDHSNEFSLDIFSKKF